MSAKTQRQSPSVRTRPGWAIDEATHTYIARWKSCDCVVAAGVDVPGDERETAKYVADWVRHGYRLERLERQVVRDMDWRCAEHPKGTPYPWDIERKQAAKGLWEAVEP